MNNIIVIALHLVGLLIDTFCFNDTQTKTLINSTLEATDSPNSIINKTELDVEVLSLWIPNCQVYTVKQITSNHCDYTWIV